MLSDTHGYWDEKFETYFAPCDEIWHAGDIGSTALADRFEALKPFRAVYGNIDDYKTRVVYPQTLRFTVEKVEVLMTHIGGYPVVMTRLFVHSSLLIHQNCLSPVIRTF